MNLEKENSALHDVPQQGAFVQAQNMMKEAVHSPSDALCSPRAKPVLLNSAQAFLAHVGSRTA